MTLTDDGCVADPHTVRVGPGILRIGPGDWEAQGLVRPEVVTLDRSFWIDAQEVTWARWTGCVQAGQCAALVADEPGRPVRSVTFLEAEAFCRYAGGRLPTLHEWQFAASGPDARRYPWGDTGAVCRRASWGLASGPCGFDATGPDIAGMHVDGASPEGILDLAGSVAEWVVRPHDTPTTCGGSWRTSLATGLRTWRTEDRDPRLRWDDVGVRCCYDREP